MISTISFVFGLAFTDPASEYDFGFCESAPRQPAPSTQVGGVIIEMPRYGEISIADALHAHPDTPHHDWHAGAVWAERIDHAHGTIIRHIWDDCVDLIVGRYFLLSKDGEVLGSGSGLATHHRSGFIEDRNGVVFWNSFHCTVSSHETVPVEVLTDGAADFVWSWRPRRQICEPGDLDPEMGHRLEPMPLGSVTD